MEPIVSLKTAQNDLETEISVACGELSADEIGYICSEADKADRAASLGYDGIHTLNKDIDRLTCNASLDDYAVSAMCGFVAGRINSAVEKAKRLGYGKPKNKNGDSARAEHEGDELSVLLGDSMPKGPDTPTAVKGAFGTENIALSSHPDNENGMLITSTYKSKEEEPSNGDGGFVFSEEILNGIARELGEEPPDKATRLSHSKTLLGLIMSVSEQFSGSPELKPEPSASRQELTVEINSHGSFVSREKKGKIFSGILNWFFNVARDMANGSNAPSVKGKTRRPLASLLSLSEELSALPCLKCEDLGERLHASLDGFLAKGGSGVARLRADLNDTFVEKDEGKRDILKGQRASVTFNELLIRAVFFVKGFISQMNKAHSLSLLNYCELMPYKDRTLSRMISVSFGVFTAVDVTRAAIKSAAKGGAASLPKFLFNTVLKINIAGVGRFATELKYDAEMLCEREELRDERIRLCGEQLALNNTKIFYKQAGMWIQAESAVKTLTEASLAARKAVDFYNRSVNEMTEDISDSSNRLRDLVSGDKELLSELDGILKYE